MKITLRKTLIWLFLGPCLALVISFPSWYLLDYISPDKLTGIAEMVGVYPKGLLMSLLTPWGWLMYGGLVMLSGDKQKPGVICTVAGAIILGVLFPVWATFIVGV